MLEQKFDKRQLENQQTQPILKETGSEDKNNPCLVDNKNVPSWR